MPKDQAIECIDILANLFDNQVFIASSPKNQEIETVPFASASLNDATHFWGVPLRRITQFFGQEGSGKTLMAMLSVVAFQKKYPKTFCVWVDAESSFDRKWAASLGIDLDRLIIVTSNNGGDIFHILCGKPPQGKAKTGKPGIFDWVQEGRIDVKLVVIDSIAAIIPPVEASRNLDDQDIAALARFLPKAFRSLASKTAKSDTAVICINQAREKIGERIPTLTYPGGRTYRHMISLNIKFQGSKAKDKMIIDSTGKKVGHKVIATIEKTRGGPDGMKAEFWLHFYKGIVLVGEEVAVLGAAYGVISKPSPKKLKYNDLEAVGAENFGVLLDNSPDEMEEIIKAIRVAKLRGVERPAALSSDSENIDDDDAVFDDTVDDTSDDDVESESEED